MSELEYVPADAFTRQFSNIYQEDDMEIKRFSEEVKTAARIAAERPHARGSWINAVTPILEEAAAKMYAPKPEPVKVGDKVKILDGLGGSPAKKGQVGEVDRLNVCSGGFWVKFADGETWYYSRDFIEPVISVDWRSRAERAEEDKRIALEGAQQSFLRCRKAEARLEAIRAAMETYMRSRPDGETSYVLAMLAGVGGFTVKPRVIHPAPPIEPLCVLDQAA